MGEQPERGGDVLLVDLPRAAREGGGTEGRGIEALEVGHGRWFSRIDVSGRRSSCQEGAAPSIQGPPCEQTCCPHEVTDPPYIDRSLMDAYRAMSDAVTLARARHERGNRELFG
ncbi:hypothetical protein GCM10022215_26610 [Nocardioides fonticola]|uniref:Uncharacterized protein n=1 Tax=Nocardioides fonticola TaxID=450363 RepID=A0ABP7XMD8_9ACTN